MSMSRQVALLRGINNAGKSTRVAMSDLRVLFEELGFREVQTLLNSGNVVFSARSGCSNSSARIQKALASKLKLTPRVIVLSADDIAATVHDNPFSRVATNPSHLLVIIPGLPTGLRQLQPLLKQRWAPESFAIGSRAAYLWCANGVAKSPLWLAVDRALERTGTARNITTMTKLMTAVGNGPDD
jgi:uncharacterized protein (DUF1697 family)